MVSFVPPEQCSFSLEDGDAVITLTEVTVSATEGWSPLNRATFVVVDGPGDEGFLVRRASPDGSDSAPDRWTARRFRRWRLARVARSGESRASPLD